MRPVIVPALMAASVSLVILGASVVRLGRRRPPEAAFRDAYGLTWILAASAVSLLVPVLRNAGTAGAQHPSWFGILAVVALAAMAGLTTGVALQARAASAGPVAVPRRWWLPPFLAAAMVTMTLVPTGVAIAVIGVVLIPALVVAFVCQLRAMGDPTRLLRAFVRPLGDVRR